MIANFVSKAIQRNVLLNAIKISIVVGSILNLINQG